MTKFKARDRVRATVSDIPYLSKGDEGRVIRVNDNDGTLCVRWDRIYGCGCWHIAQDNAELIKGAEMRKEDLEDGMAVEARNGRFYVLFNGRFLRKGGFNKLSEYNNNLKIESNKCYDIMAVYAPIKASYLDELLKNNSYGDPIWTRKEEETEVTLEETEVTLEEIAEKFGVDVGSLKIKK